MSCHTDVAIFGKSSRRVRLFHLKTAAANVSRLLTDTSSRNLSKTRFATMSLLILAATIEWSLTGLPRKYYLRRDRDTSLCEKRLVAKETFSKLCVENLAKKFGAGDSDVEDRREGNFTSGHFQQTNELVITDGLEQSRA